MTLSRCCPACGEVAPWALPVCVACVLRLPRTLGMDLHRAACTGGPSSPLWGRVQSLAVERAREEIAREKWTAEKRHKGRRG